MALAYTRTTSATTSDMRTADDLFGGPEGGPRTDKLIAASVQRAQLIMKKVDEVARRQEQ